MRRRHFETLRPSCPSCRRGQGEDSPLELAQVEREDGDVVLEGFLRCPACEQHLPILDGVPILVADVQRVVQGQIAALGGRRDLSGAMADFLGSCCGPGSAFETTRYHLSIYARDHYGDFDPEDREPGDRDPEHGGPDRGGPKVCQPEDGGQPPPLSAVALLERGLQALPPLPEGPVIDVGCSVGRTSFELAAHLDRPVLGVDLSFPMLRLAQDVLLRGRLRYPRRIEGTRYRDRSFDVPLPHRGRVDFWLCDAGELPFPAATFAGASHLNVLDCVASPHGALEALERILAPGAAALLATPYDWSPGATAVEAWIGGHSQRGARAGRSEPVLRALLGGEHPAALEGLELIAEPDTPPWRLRLDARHAASYRSHLLVLSRRQDPPGVGPPRGRAAGDQTPR